MSTTGATMERELFPRLLKEMREAVGLSQAEMAAKIGVHRSYICMLESGARNPSDAVLYRIAKVCGIAYEELCSQIGRVPNHEDAVREWVEHQEDPARVELFRTILELDDESIRAMLPIAKRLLGESISAN